MYVIYQIFCKAMLKRPQACNYSFEEVQVAFIPTKYWLTTLIQESLDTLMCRLLRVNEGSNSLLLSFLNGLTLLV